MQFFSYSNRSSLILVLFGLGLAFLTSSCKEQIRHDQIEKIARKRLKKVADKKRRKCDDIFYEKANRLADSIVINTIAINRQQLPEEDIPEKPGKPELIPLKDSSDVAPLF